MICLYVITRNTKIYNRFTKVDLLLELAILNELIQPYLETALAIDETQHYERLLEEKEAILDDLENFQ